MSNRDDALIQEWEAKVSEANDGLGSARTALNALPATTLNAASLRRERAAVLKEIEYWTNEHSVAMSGLAARHQFLLREVTSR